MLSLKLAVLDHFPSFAVMSALLFGLIITGSNLITISYNQPY